LSKERKEGLENHLMVGSSEGGNFMSPSQDGLCCVVFVTYKPLSLAWHLSRGARIVEWEKQQHAGRVNWNFLVLV
jgi:hypothetical protein